MDFKGESGGAGWARGKLGTMGVNPNQEVGSPILFTETPTADEFCHESSNSYDLFHRARSKQITARSRFIY